MQIQTDSLANPTKPYSAIIFEEVDQGTLNYVKFWKENSKKYLNLSY